MILNQIDDDDDNDVDDDDHHHDDDDGPGQDRGTLWEVAGPHPLARRAGGALRDSAQTWILIAVQSSTATFGEAQYFEDAKYSEMPNIIG